MRSRRMWGTRRKAAVVGVLSAMVVVWVLSMGSAHGEDARRRAQMSADDRVRIEKDIAVWLDIEQELDTILATQEEILLKLEQAVTDSKILKVRANRRRAP